MSHIRIYKVITIGFVFVFGGYLTAVSFWPKPQAAEAHESPTLNIQSGSLSTQADSLQSPDTKGLYSSVSVTSSDAEVRWQSVLDRILLDKSQSTAGPTGTSATSPPSTTTADHIASPSNAGQVGTAAPATSGDPATTTSTGSGSSPTGGTTTNPGGAGGGGRTTTPTDVYRSPPVNEIASVYVDNGAFLVETSDARFEYAAGVIKIFQGPLPAHRRLIATVTFNDSFSFAKKFHTSSSVSFQSNGASIQINRDSACRIELDSSSSFTLQTEFPVQYLSKDKDKAVLAGIGGKLELHSDSLAQIVVDQDNPVIITHTLTRTATIRALNTPIVMWTHNIYTDSLDALQTALSSGLITHVMIKRLHRYDCTIHQYARHEPTVPKAINLCQQLGVPVVLARNLWPSWRIRETREATLLQKDYYINEIYHLRKEALELGAEYIALDSEPYGDSPIKNMMRRLTNRELEQLRAVMQAVIDATGQIDFVLPAGSNLVVHPYNLNAMIGRNRICEHTYWDNPSLIRGVKYPYEVFGAFINTEKQHPRRDHTPYYLVEEIFDRAHLWVGKEGLFLWKESQGRENHALTLAQLLTHYNLK